MGGTPRGDGSDRMPVARTRATDSWPCEGDLMNEQACPPTTVLTKETAGLSDEDRHRFLGYLVPQLEPLRQSCEHNWLIQAVLITVAAINLYKPDLVNGIAESVKVPVGSLNLVVPIVLTYLLIRFGYLLNAYMFIREGITEMLKAFTVRPPEFQEAQAERMLRANSLVELLYLNFDVKGPKDFKKLPYKAALPILGFLLTLIFALNHVLTLLYLGRLVGHNRKLSVPIGLGIMLIIGACYMQFVGTATRKGARTITKGVMWLTLPLFLLVHWSVYGSLW
jgi:hypothetical protein